MNGGRKCVRVCCGGGYHVDLCTAVDHDVLIEQINELVKRARALKVHALVIGHLKKLMPAFFSKVGYRGFVPPLDLSWFYTCCPLRHPHTEPVTLFVNQHLRFAVNEGNMGQYLRPQERGGLEGAHSYECVP